MRNQRLLHHTMAFEPMDHNMTGFEVHVRPFQFQALCYTAAQRMLNLHQNVEPDWAMLFAMSNPLFEGVAGQTRRRTERAKGCVLVRARGCTPDRTGCTPVFAGGCAIAPALANHDDAQNDGRSCYYYYYYHCRDSR